MPSQTAAAGGHVSSLRVLLYELGVDPDLEDKYGQAPAHKAAEFGYVRVLQLLKGRGADLRRRTTARAGGDTPLSLALSVSLGAAERGGKADEVTTAWLLEREGAAAGWAAGLAAWCLASPLCRPRRAFVHASPADAVPDGDAFAAAQHRLGD
eukprot:gene27200-44232_t